MAELDRIIFCSATGSARYGEMAMGLGRSLSLIGDETPRAIVTDIQGYDWKRYFDFVFEPKSLRSALDKILALDYVDARAVYAIDVDCLAFKRLDAVFSHFSGLPFGVQGTWQREGIWHGAEISKVLTQHGYDRLPKFNGGALYYESGTEFSNLLAEMKSVEAQYDKSGFGDFRGNASEEVCIALAMAKTGIGSVISDETNFMHTGSGVVGKLHLDIRANTCRFISRKGRVRYVEPYIFHASEYCNFTIYWRQLEHLKKLERYENRTRPGHRSRWFKLRRSFERRYLKLRGYLT